MKTIILPGYSPHNSELAENVAVKLNGKNIKTQVHYWNHWRKATNFSIKKEIKKTVQEVGGDDVNIIAKSVGVMVAMNLIPIIFKKVKKVILCGIASVQGDERRKALKEFLAVVPTENILCIQNKKDRFVPYQEAKKFYHSVEPELKVIEKPRSDHNYPYSEDFINFLK